jgi:hypothetical protein
VLSGDSDDPSTSPTSAATTDSSLPRDGDGREFSVAATARLRRACLDAGIRAETCDCGIDAIFENLSVDQFEENDRLLGQTGGELIPEVQALLDECALQN